MGGATDAFINGFASSAMDDRGRPFPSGLGMDSAEFLHGFFDGSLEVGGRWGIHGEMSPFLQRRRAGGLVFNSNRLLMDVFAYAHESEV